MTGRDPRFRINTAPGIMEPTRGVNEAHGSFLQRPQVIELRDELNAWLAENPDHWWACAVNAPRAEWVGPCDCHVSRQKVCPTCGQATDRTIRSLDEEGTR
jgi:hypothetical protein